MSRETGNRDRILARIRAANAERAAPEHPGDFEGWRPPGDGSATADDATARFAAQLVAVGGEVVRVADPEAGADWLRTFATDFSAVAVGRGVPAALAPEMPRVDAAEAGLAISMARAGVAETGSVVLDARDGRRTQLLSGTHVAVVEEGSIRSTLRDALRSVSDDLPAAIGLHSGPSKSADIGQVMVKGVHGPGRLVVLLIGSGR